MWRHFFKKKPLKPSAKHPRMTFLNPCEESHTAPVTNQKLDLYKGHNSGHNN